MLDLTAQENVDKILEVFNEDVDHPDSPWDEDIQGDAVESAYFLLESPKVWAFLVSNQIEAVRLIEQIHPRIESIAVIDPGVLTLLETRKLVAKDCDGAFEP